MSISDQERGDDSGGIFQFGHSVGFNDEMRRTILAEVETFAKESFRLSEAIGVEEKLHAQAATDCSHAKKEIGTHVRSQKETTDRLGVNVEFWTSLTSTLKAELVEQKEQQGANGNSGLGSSTSGNSGGGSTSPEEDESTLPSRDDRSFAGMNRFDLVLAKTLKQLFHTFRKIHETLISQSEAVHAIKKEADSAEQGIVSQSLETSLAKAQESTISKEAILEDLIRRMEGTRSSKESSEHRLQELDDEHTNLRQRYFQREQHYQTELTERNKRLSLEEEALVHEEENLRQVQKSKQDVEADMETLKMKEAELAEFLEKLHGLGKKREELRVQRNQLYSSKKSMENNVASKKSSIDYSKRAIVDAEKAMEEVQKVRLENNKHEAEVIFPARSELEDVVGQKKTCEETLAKASKPITDRNTFANETSRLEELQLKHVMLQKRSETKMVRLEENNRAHHEQHNQLKTDMKTLREAANRTTIEKDKAKTHLECLRAKKFKLAKARRTNEVLEYGRDYIQKSRKEEQAAAATRAAQSIS